MQQQEDLSPSDREALNNLEQELMISDWYVEWANTLDSSGKDSSAVVNRLSVPMVRLLTVTMNDIIETGTAADKLKKYLFYGKEMEMFLSAGAVSDKTLERLRLNSHETIRLIHALLGIAGEVGEMMENLVAHIFEGKEIDVTNIIEEAGDSIWYHSLIAKWAGYNNFDPILQANYNKLTTRYPEGKWTQERALNRNLGQELRALLGDIQRVSGTKKGDVNENTDTGS